MEIGVYQLKTLSMKEGKASFLLQPKNIAMFNQMKIRILHRTYFQIQIALNFQQKREKKGIQQVNIFKYLFQVLEYANNQKFQYLIQATFQHNQKSFNKKLKRLKQKLTSNYFHRKNHLINQNKQNLTIKLKINQSILSIAACL